MGSGLRSSTRGHNASELDAPPVVPHELVKVVLRHFILDVLNIYRPHLDRFWSEEEIDEIEVEQRDPIKRYNNDQHIEHIIDSYKHTVSFNEVWDKIDVPFNRLHQFCDGLAMGWRRRSQTQCQSNQISPF
ncbi:unnamed protein product [Sphagnum jensenii]|uniref:Transposase n=1 Tax=Sphagnum jensenii TaxID=128206 RepID=A0ABP0VXK2_9BRYO